MDAQQIITVSAAVVALTQLVKWAFVPDRWGPLAVLLLSLLGVALWAYSEGIGGRGALWPLFAGWIAVATSAAGVFGFSRATAAVVTRATAPPAAGTGGERTQP